MILPVHHTAAHATAQIALPHGTGSPSATRSVPLSLFLHDTPAPHLLTYKTAPSGPLSLAVFNPTAWKSSDKRPLVVFIHGGAWTAGDGKVFYPHARYFASRGAVAVSIDNRLQTQTGSGISECLMDCKSAMRYLRAHASSLGIDPVRIVALGDSAGGHLAAALGSCPGFDDPQDDSKISAVPNAMILCNPITNLTENDWIKHVMSGDTFRSPLPSGDRVPNSAELELARALSPVFHIQPGQPCVLLMQGTSDHIVQPEQARILRQPKTSAVTDARSSG